MSVQRIFILLAACLSFLALTACSPVYQTNYSYLAPKTWRGKQCANRCLQDRSACRAQCLQTSQSCRNSANLAATPAYLIYVEQQRRHHLPLDQTITDFADYSGCTNHCGCESSYRECFTNCGGEVMANTQCVAFCKSNHGAVN